MACFSPRSRSNDRQAARLFGTPPHVSSLRDLSTSAPAVAPASPLAFFHPRAVALGRTARTPRRRLGIDGHATHTKMNVVVCHGQAQLTDFSRRERRNRWQFEFLTAHNLHVSSSLSSPPPLTPPYRAHPFSKRQRHGHLHPRHSIGFTSRCSDRGMNSTEIDRPPGR